MSAPGRNDPCPCGSGKKFKRCCGALAVAPSFFLTQSERDELTRRMVQFLHQEPQEEYLELAAKTLFSTHFAESPPELVKRVLAYEITQTNFTAYALFDVLWTEDASVAELFLELHEERLTPAQVRYLEAASETYVGLYEVTEVVLGEGVRVLDLLGGDTIWVRERSATRSLARWDVLGARLLREPGGDAIFLADLYPFPQSVKAIVLKHVRGCLGLSGKRRFDVEKLLPDLKFLAPAFFAAWWRLVVHPPLPRLVNFDGQEFRQTANHYDTTDPAAVRRILDATSELETDDEGGWVWLREADGEQRVVARVRLEGHRLEIETNSAERTRMARELLEERLGALAIRRSESTDDARRQLERLRDGEALPARRREENELPADVQERVRLEYLERHYRAWIDQPVPLLQNRTPRHAARLKTQRHKVVDLIKSMENSEARGALAGESPYDFGWMWGELGLERPGG